MLTCWWLQRRLRIIDKHEGWGDHCRMYLPFQWCWCASNWLEKGLQSGYMKSTITTLRSTSTSKYAHRHFVKDVQWYSPSLGWFILGRFDLLYGLNKTQGNHRWQNWLEKLNSENQNKSAYLCDPIFVEAIIFYQEGYETLERGRSNGYIQYVWMEFKGKQGRSVGTSSSGAVHFNSGISNVTLGSLNKRRASW